MQITIHYKIAICPNYTGLLFNLGQSRRNKHVSLCHHRPIIGMEIDSCVIFINDMRFYIENEFYFHEYYIYKNIFL